jgi:hypothetical protein
MNLKSQLLEYLHNIKIHAPHPERIEHYQQKLATKDIPDTAESAAKIAGLINILLYQVWEIEIRKLKKSVPQTELLLPLCIACQNLKLISSRRNRPKGD